jgi:tRNA A37 methylthiotransferase MiaB
LEYRKTEVEMNKLFILTHGCQMNEYDSSKMMDVLRESHQLEKTTDPMEADVLLLNTCSIREKAQEKIFSDLGRWREFKLKKPHVIIGVGGCVASQEGAAILKRAPFVDMIFGPQTLHRLGDMLTQAKQQRKARNSTNCLNPARKALRRMSPSWKAVANIVVFVWCPIPAAKKSAAHWMTY